MIGEGEKGRGGFFIVLHVLSSYWIIKQHEKKQMIQLVSH